MNEPLHEQFWRWAESTVDEDGFSMPYALSADAKGQVTVMALAVPSNQVYRYVLGHVAKERPAAAIFAMDRFAQPGQGLRYKDLLAGHYFEAGVWRPFIIEYRYDPRAFEPINWENQYWNAALRRELAQAIGTMLVAAG